MLSGTLRGWQISHGHHLQTSTPTASRNMANRRTCYVSLHKRPTINIGIYLDEHHFIAEMHCCCTHQFCLDDIINQIYRRGKVFTACVRSTMLHGSETWAPNASDLQRLRRNDRTMIRWICGAKLADKIPTAVLHRKLDLDDITAVLRTRHLRWYGHVQRATSCINSIMRLELPGTRDRGRPRKTWSACVRND